MNNRRFIEESFPVKEVGEISAKEKNIRHGHISTLHIWWSRKPLAVSRAITLASLIKAPEDFQEQQNLKKFISDLSKWENSNNSLLIEEARKKILEANKGVPPKILDPFAGGGSIPLEALRLGCEVYANDYNPVAVLILKATLEYPQKFGRPFEGMPDFKKIHKDKFHTFNFDDSLNSKIINPLLFAVEYWGNWVLNEAKKELSDFYNNSNGQITIGYYWMRTVPCQNPVCGIQIPLTANWWLAKKDKKKIALYPKTKGPGYPVEFDIVAQDLPDYKPWPKNFNPEYGTVSRANVRCPACGSIIDDKTTRKLFQEGKSGERMVAVVYTKPNSQGKFYRLADNEDIETFEKAKKYLEIKIEELREKWLMEPVPDEDMDQEDPTTLAGRGYGVKKWGDLFNPRQKLSLIVFADAIKRAYELMIACKYSEEFAKATEIYLGIIISRISDKNSRLCRVIVQTEAIGYTFGKQALPMLWDYLEMNILENSSGWNETFLNLLDNILNLSNILIIKYQVPVIKITQISAVNQSYLEDYFDAVITDPPYYDNVSYATLSDFFYVWLKRTIGHLYPELFATPLTPKSGEIIANVPLHKDKAKAKKFFEEQLSLSFKEMYRILKPGGIAVIVYAHKSTAGWETVINALLDSGLVVNASWPINTEMQERLNAQETASLASSIYIVARKMERKDVGFYPKVKEELKNYLNQKLDKLWAEGIGGADFFISAIGAGIEVFGKYEKVMDYEGNIIRADRLLEDIRKIATDYAVHQILHNGFAGEINELTRFYVLYRWDYGEAKVQFDEARKLATSCGIDLALEWNKKGFIKKEKEFIKVLGPQERKIEELINSLELIDVLHYVLLLWEKGRKDDIINVLQQTGYGKSEAFYRVAQAISETLSRDSKEKKLLDGFLVGREQIQRNIISSDSSNAIQGELGL